MRVVSAAEFSRMTGYPLDRVKRACREGRIPGEISGSRYFIDYDRAIAALTELFAAKPPAPEKPKLGKINTFEAAMAVLCPERLEKRKAKAARAATRTASLPQAGQRDIGSSISFLV